MRHNDAHPVAKSQRVRVGDGLCVIGGGKKQYNDAHPVAKSQRVRVGDGLCVIGGNKFKYRY